MAEDERRRYRMLRGAYAYLASSANKHEENLLPFRTSGTSTSHGITFIYNANGTVNVNGQNDGSVSFSTGAIPFYLEPGEYKKSPVLGNVKLFIQYRISDSSWGAVEPDIQNKDYFTIDERGLVYPIVARLRVEANASVDNVLYEPYIYLVRKKI